MTLAREINEKLDEMLSVQSQIKELTELESDAKFSNTIFYGNANFIAR